MKLVIQIPCHNEQESVLEVINSIPKKIKGIDEIKIFVIDDGSFDKTSELAKNIGVEVVSIPYKKGLANAFRVGVKRALELNADILVNIDGDNQYNACDIEKLIEPILNNQADMVIGSRPIDKIVTFSPLKNV